MFAELASVGMYLFAKDFSQVPFKSPDKENAKKKQMKKTRLSVIMFSPSQLSIQVKVVRALLNEGFRILYQVPLYLSPLIGTLADRFFLSSPFPVPLWFWTACFCL